MAPARCGCGFRSPEPPAGHRRLAYNGGGWSTVSYPPTGGWGAFGASVNATVNLTAGWNTIRLAKGAPNFARGVGYTELDAITLS